ncbi:hypothetical protein BSU04_40470 [Caballeronia sordidicola]|uniref:Uncharacterized protein n=1 Tax=Caballeronia sordidicola TaxID=196367 RepID=A0A226WNM4_CABSO|nr:hypothetical protein BSU04_40470 [Caballeronia sordidicola]
MTNCEPARQHLLSRHTQMDLRIAHLRRYGDGVVRQVNALLNEVPEALKPTAK